MAIIFSKNSGINDDMWKDTDVAVRSWMVDTDNEKNQYKDTLNAIYNVEKSDRFGEKFGSMTEFDNFEIVPEGGKSVLDDVQEGNTKLITHTQKLKGFIITAEMLEDNNVSDMKRKAANFVRAYQRSLLQEATDVLTGATATSVVSLGKSHDTTAADGKALFATNHTTIKGGYTQSNVFTNAFGTNDAMLFRLANIGKNFKNDSGHPMGFEYDTIIIPSDVPELERLIKKIIASDQQVGNDYNDVNVSKGKWKLIVNPLWSKGGAATDPYIIMSSQANKELAGNMFFDRVPLTVKEHVDEETFNLCFNGRYRSGVGFNAWQHIIMGGAAQGTTLQ